MNPTALHIVLLPLLLVAALLRPAAAQEDDEQRPGLIGVYKAGTRSVTRVDDDIAFHWGTSSPDIRLPTAPFEVTWTGQIVVQSDEPIRFHADLQGAIEVRVDDEVVLQGESKDRGWIRGEPKSLSLGFRDLKMTFKKVGRASHVFLAWSGDKFPIEPLPWQFLFHEGRLPEDELWNRGRQLYTAYRCNRCHHRPGEPESPFAPALLRVTTDLNPEWLVEKLLDQNPESPHAKMPSFGMTRKQAEQMADWLWRISQPAQLPKTPAVDAKKAKEIPSGETLIHSLGCMACHTHGTLGESGPFGGGALDHVGNKRSEDWIYTWLGQPEKLSPVTSMPVFKMTPSERATIAKTLAHSKKEGTRFDRESETDTKRVEAGRELARRFKCANCHTMPAIDPELRGLPTLEEEVKDWTKSCLADAPDQDRNRPYYPRADKAALKAYVSSRIGAISPVSEFETGRQILERRNCLSCHPRGNDRGLAEQAGNLAANDSALAGVAPTLVAPNLTAIGDKQRDDFLAKAISGMQPDMRMTWLRARMPRFTHREDEKQALLNHLVEHDRIADGADPAARAHLAEISDEERLVVGRRLVGAGGFSCIACHQFGTYVPKNVALGTKGANLMGLGERLRPEYFLRWVNSPLRIIPGFEMPSYQRPVPGVLGDDVTKQLSAVWHAVNDPKFEAPTNPTAVEQFLAVSPGERPRIVRDVFTAPEANGGGTIARGLAIGFDNGHSLLFDFGRGTLRDWTVGDFARQRTEGKSWYWDLAGLRALEGFDDQPEIRFYNPATKEWLDAEGVGRLELAGYRTAGTPAAVEIDLRLPVIRTLDSNETQHSLDLHSRFAARTGEDGTGWERTLTLRGPQVAELKGLIPYLVLPTRWTSKLGATVHCLENGDPLDIDDRHAAHPFTASGSGDWTATVRYTTRSASPPTVLPAAPPAPPRPPAPHVTTLAGYDGVRLPLPESIMPTAITWLADGTLAFTSLKGHVYLAKDTDGDGLAETLQLFEEGLAAPFGILEDKGDLIVAHKPEVLRLKDTDGDGRCDLREVVATGWGYTKDYHDWTTGIVRDEGGHLYIGTSSDYTDKSRDKEELGLRGKILRIAPDGTKEAIAHDLRYPIGLALNGQGKLFVSDQQGVQNTFNEILCIERNQRYGVPSQNRDGGGELAVTTIQVPHPWSRSINGIVFLDPAKVGKDFPFAGHGIGAEYDNRFVMRFSIDEVDGELQGATYPFSAASWKTDGDTFLGPIAINVSPQGDIYVGGMHDSGWHGGLNTGEIVRLHRTADPLPLGIREVRATPTGFELSFTGPVDAVKGADPASYAISGYTRRWKGDYATPDSDRFSPRIEKATLSTDRTSVRLDVADLKTEFVYEFTLEALGPNGGKLWPATAAYTLNRRPR